MIQVRFSLGGVETIASIGYCGKANNFYWWLVNNGYKVTGVRETTREAVLATELTDEQQDLLKATIKKYSVEDV